MADRLVVNAKFADTYAKKKREEELTRYKQADLEALGLLSDDSESEDESGRQLSKSKNRRIDEVVAMIERKDPRIYDESFRAFKAKTSGAAGGGSSSSSSDGDSDGSSEEEVRGARKQKPMYIRDHLRNVVVHGAMEDNAAATMPSTGPSYPEQQSELKQAFAAAADANSGSDESSASDGSGSGDDLFTVRSKPSAAAAAAVSSRAKPASGRAPPRPYASSSADGDGDGKPKESDPAFLKRFMNSFAWREMGGDFGGEAEDSVEDVEVDAAEAFEAQYNHRYDDGSGAFNHEAVGKGGIVGHVRTVEGSVRRVSGKREKRGRQREEKKSRKEEKKRAKLQELKRLKNLKRRDIMRKLKEIEAVAGSGVHGGLIEGNVDLEGEWDPAAHDAAMSKLFSGVYDEGDDDWAPEGAPPAAQLAAAMESTAAANEVAEEVEVEEAYAEEAASSSAAVPPPPPKRSTSASRRRRTPSSIGNSNSTTRTSSVVTSRLASNTAPFPGTITGCRRRRF